MLICGIKLTHDASIALIENNTLIFSIEIEKLNNNPRYTEITDTSLIQDLLSEYGYEIKDIDKFIIDGWVGVNTGHIRYTSLNKQYEMEVAPYNEDKLSDNMLINRDGSEFRIGNEKVDYASFMHITGHVTSAYCSSEFASRNEASYVLVWDGGIYPRLYYADPVENKIDCLGELLYIVGDIYREFPLYFSPFQERYHPSTGAVHAIAGKLMAYIAKGSVRDDIVNELEFIYNNYHHLLVVYSQPLARIFRARNDHKGYKHEDILASFHEFLERLLLKELKKKIDATPEKMRNLCFAGGCALNIKWNSAIRAGGLFNHVWVPPFPNDSGSAIGAACAGMIHYTNNYALDWNVYSGPKLKSDTHLIEGWTSRDCSIKELAKLLHEEPEPVVFLNGNAELGPRALGNRSIIAAAVDKKMQIRLNAVKRREDYRPVAPICMEEYAKEVFSPGTPDPYMLFDHQVNEEWTSRVPAIIHLDGTSRVQTVSKELNSTVYELLNAYYQITGIPVLTNTSANDNGTGFFPDIESAMKWGRVNYIWSENKLYIKDVKVKYE